MSAALVCAVFGQYIRCEERKSLIIVRNIQNSIFNFYDLNIKKSTKKIDFFAIILYNLHIPF